MRVLVIHPGYSFPRHFNYHEIVSRLLKEVYAADIDMLSCDKAINACSFRSALGAKISSPFILKGGRLGCWKCQRQHKKRTAVFCDNNISVAKNLSKKDYIEAVSIANQLCGNRDIDDLLSLEVCGVNIGIDVWQSIQRYLFVGTPEKILIKKDSVEYEFIKSGLLYATAMDRILKKSKYDYILTNERAYLEWGIANRIALSRGINVIHTGQDYFTGIGYQGLNISILRAQSEIGQLFYSPKKYITNKVFDDESLLNKSSAHGLIKLEKWMRRGNSVIDTNKILEWFSVERKTVVVFTHLCWDAAITYGDMLYHSFEEWLRVTYEIAVQNKNVDWVFRVHPAEAKVPLSDELNTLILLRQLASIYRVDHIKIMVGDINIKTIDMMPYMYAGVTALGTVAFELPSHGIPCIVASKEGYADYEFSISGNSKCEYEEMLRHISNIKPPTEKQIKLAQAYAGLVLNDYYILSVDSLFEEDDCNDKSLDRGRVSDWISDIHNQKYLQSVILEKLSFVKTH